MRNTCRVLIGKLKAKGPLGRVRHRWENNIKLRVKEIRCEDVDRIHVSQDNISNRSECSNEPFDSIKGGGFIDYLIDF